MIRLEGVETPGFVEGRKKVSLLCGGILRFMY